MRGIAGAAHGEPAEVAHVQRHADRLLVGGGALAAHPVRAAVLAVVGGEQDDRVGLHGGLGGERGEHRADLRVDVALQHQVGVHQPRPPAERFGAAEGDGAEGARGGVLQRALQ